jgi:hypothetical protein
LIFSAGGAANKHNRKMLLETHAHTSRHSSCSGLGPAELVRRCAAKKLQGVIIVEHHFLWKKPELEELKRDTGMERGFVILAGQEIQTGIGHVIVIGAGETIRAGTEIGTIGKRWPAAALILAHPFRGGRLPSDALLLDRRMDAVEIFNTNQTMKENCAALAAWHRLKFTAVAGSDAHAAATAGVYPTLFDHPVSSEKEAAEEIKKGRTRPFHKEIPKAGGNVTVTEITIGTKGDDEARRRVILRTFDDEKKYLRARQAAKLAEALRASGFAEGIFRVPAVIEIQDAEKIIIEEGQRGKNLRDIAANSSTEAARRDFELAARWLARLHSADRKKILRGCGINSPSDTLERERKRLRGYLDSFAATDNPMTDDARKIISAVGDAQEILLGAGSQKTSRRREYALCHGDYHPKNIIIGQDISDDTATRFISVIDFGSALVHLPAFDVGYFLAQSENQFFGEAKILRNFVARDFIDAYIDELPAGKRAAARRELPPLADFYKARANLSIAAFLIKVGKGESPETAAAIRKSLKIIRRIVDTGAAPGIKL